MTKEKLALEIIDRLKKEYPDAGCASCASAKDRGRAPQLLSCSGDFLFVIRIVYCPSWKKEGLMTDCRMDIP